MLLLMLLGFLPGLLFGGGLLYRAVRASRGRPATDDRLSNRDDG